RIVLSIGTPRQRSRSGCSPDTARNSQRVAIVTGGARGISAAITTALARSGVHVAAGYSRNAQAAAERAPPAAGHRPRPRR
ncbi:MAG: SDR family NAD(P)-dependent oxidoreductase, partial [Pseudonocardiaceae bacterium]